MNLITLLLVMLSCLFVCSPILQKESDRENNILKGIVSQIYNILLETEDQVDSLKTLGKFNMGEK